MNTNYEKRRSGARTTRIQTYRSFVTRGAVVAALALVPMGCEFLGLDGDVEQPETTQQTAPPPKTPPPVVTPPPAEVAEYVRPEYPNMTRRNPFQPDIEVLQPVNVPTEGDERTLEPLEQYSLGELELVAIISEVAVPKAMFIDPEGFGHVLKEGDRIGRNAGVISDVRDNEVEITESAGEEGTQTRLRTIKLRDVDLSVGDGSTLSEEERAALEKLLSTEEGRNAVQRQYRDMALGANAAEGGADGQQQQQPESGNAPPRRGFPGVQPPPSREQ